MWSALIAGVKPHPDDIKIDALLRETTVAPPGKMMRVGIRNNAGAIYKSIVTRGATEFILVVSSLEQLDFRDELEGVKRANGYDAIFSKKVTAL